MVENIHFQKEFEKFSKSRGMWSKSRIIVEKNTFKKFSKSRGMVENFHFQKIFQVQGHNEKNSNSKIFSKSRGMV